MHPILRQPDLPAPAGETCYGGLLGLLLSLWFQAAAFWVTTFAVAVIVFPAGVPRRSVQVGTSPVRHVGGATHKPDAPAEPDHAAPGRIAPSSAGCETRRFDRTDAPAGEDAPRPARHKELSAC